jgi:hypothetical protein
MGWKDWVAPVVGGIGDIVGGIIGQEGAEQQADAQMSINDENRKMEYEFARRGLGWKIEDAAKYGISPLAALGGSTTSPSVAMRAPDVASKYDAMSKMSQNISRAFQATMNQRERLTNESIEADIAQKNMLTKYYKSKISNEQKGPPFPDNGNYNISGQTSSGVKLQPLDRTISPKGRGGITVGSLPATTFKWYNGAMMPLQSPEVKQLQEDSPYEFEQYIRDRMGWGEKPLLSEIRKYAPWANDFRYDYSKGGYVPLRKKQKSYKKVPYKGPKVDLPKYHKKLINRYKPEWK